MGQWDTDFVFYYHESLDEYEAGLILFGGMRAMMQQQMREYRDKLVRRDCRRCGGTGLED